MSKKQKRKVSKGTGSARQAVAQFPVEEQAPVSAPTRTPVINRNITSRFATDFNPDHSLILSDLKRIGILAGTFISILVILSFFLN